MFTEIINYYLFQHYFLLRWTILNLMSTDYYENLPYVLTCLLLKMDLTDFFENLLLISTLCFDLSTPQNGFNRFLRKFVAYLYPMF
jgi:hypothetical protein